MKSVTKVLVLCMMLFLHLCLSIVGQAEGSIQVRLPIDMNVGAVNATSFAYDDGVLFFTNQNKISFLAAEENAIQEFMIPDLLSEIDVESDIPADSYRYKLISSSDGIYLLDLEHGTVFLVKMRNEAVTLDRVISLEWNDYMVQLPDGGHYSNPPHLYCAADFSHYALEDRGDADGKHLIEFSLSDGSKIDHSAMKVIAMSPYHGNALLLLTVDGSIYRFHRGEYELMLRMNNFVNIAPSTIFGLLYDEESDGIYLGYANSIMKVQSDGSLMSSIELPASIYQFDDSQIIAQDLCAVLTNVGILECSLTGSAASRVLTVWGNTESPEMVLASLEIPGIELKSIESDSFEVLLQNMMTRDEGVDVYRLSLSYVDFASLRGKGYYADLSSSSKLRDMYSKLYPSLQQVLGDHGKIAAIPIRAEVQGYSMYDYGFFEGENIPVPSTFEGMCIIIERWLENYAEKYDNLQPFEPYLGARRVLIEEALREYLVHMRRTDIMSFDTGLLRRMLTAAEKTAEKIEGLDHLESNVFWIGEQVTGIQDFQGDTRDGRHQLPMFLSVEQGESPALSMRVDVLLINPFSLNMDLAIQFLEKVTEKLPQTLSIMLSPSINDEIENPDYQMWHRQRQGEIDRVKAQAEGTHGAEKTMLDEQRLRLEQELAELERTGRLLVSHEDIEVYRKAMENPVIEVGGSMQLLNSSLRTSLLQYADMLIDMEQFISEVDQKWQLILKESQ